MQYNTPTNIASSLFTLCILTCLILFPIIVFEFLTIKFKNLGENKFRERFGTLYDDLRIESFNSIRYPAFFILRRLLLGIFVVRFENFGFGTVMIYLALSMVSMIYLLHVEPFVERLRKRMELFNEICILMVAYTLFIFTDYVPQKSIQGYFGYFAIALSVFNILVNLIVMVTQTYQQIKLIFLAVKQKCLNRKRNKAVAPERGVLFNNFSIDQDSQRIGDRRRTDEKSGEFEVTKVQLFSLGEYQNENATTHKTQNFERSFQA